jgi:hypothetical protein
MTPRPAARNPDAGGKGDSNNPARHRYEGGRQHDQVPIFVRGKIAQQIEPPMPRVTAGYAGVGLI